MGFSKRWIMFFANKRDTVAVLRMVNVKAVQSKVMFLYALFFYQDDL